MTEAQPKIARAIIEACEADLARRLSSGEKRDLLMDNLNWKRDDILAAAAFLEADDGDA